MENETKRPSDSEEQSIFDVMHILDAYLRNRNHILKIQRLVQENAKFFACEPGDFVLEAAASKLAAVVDEAAHRADGGFRELIYLSRDGKCLRVFPHLDFNAPDAFMASAGNCEALRYWNAADECVWGVRINISYDTPQSRVKCERLRGAIERCWQWIDEQITESQSA